MASAEAVQNQLHHVEMVERGHLLQSLQIGVLPGEDVVLEIGFRDSAENARSMP